MIHFGRPPFLTQTNSRAFLTLVTLAIAASALMPIFSTRFLPINDYPFHLARMIIFAQLDNPIFARFYQQGSFLLPNVGMDAVVVPLSMLIGPERATRVFVELTLLVLLFGTMALHWAAHRRLSVWPLLAAVFLHNGIFRFGFFNYLFGLGLALAAVALWLNMRRGIARSAFATIACAVLIFCHMEAFGVFALIVAGVELHNAFFSWKLERNWRPLGDLLHSAAPFLMTFAIFVILSPTARVIEDGFGYDPGWGTKPVGALYSLSSGILWLDVATAVSLVGLGAWVLSTKRIVVSVPLAVAFFMLVLALFALPSSLMGSLYADTRLGPAIALIAIATMDIRADAPKSVAWTALIVILFLACLQSTAVTYTWARYDSETASIVSALDTIEEGATLFSATSEPFVRLIADDSERRAAWSPPLKHVASYAVLLAPIFVPMTFADPTKQPLVVRDSYRSVKTFQGDNPEQISHPQALSAYIARLEERLGGPDWPPIASAYLLVMGRQRLEPMSLPVSVTQIAQGERFVLLRLSSRADK